MKMQHGEKRLLVVDDEPQVLSAIAHLMEDDFDVTTFTDAEAALKTLEREDVAVVVSDQRMPGLSGDQFLSRARAVSDATRLLLTGYTDMDALVRAVNSSQIFAYVEKPWDPMTFRATIKKAANYYATRRGAKIMAGETVEAGEAQGDGVSQTFPFTPIRVVVSPDGMYARIETVFPDTTREQIGEVLAQEGICRGIREEVLQDVLECARKTGREQHDVLVATGRPARYLERKKICFPFAEHLDHAEGDPQQAEKMFNGIDRVLAGVHLGALLSYKDPVAAVLPGDTLMFVMGSDCIDPGYNVFGQDIHEVSDAQDMAPLMLPGSHVTAQPDGSLTADAFGYVAIKNNTLSVLPPLWISPDRISAYAVLLAQQDAHKAPEKKMLVRLLADMHVRTGIDQEALKAVCRAFQEGDMTQRFIQIASGRHPRLPEGTLGLSPDVASEAPFGELLAAFSGSDLNAITECRASIRAVHAGMVLAELATQGDVESPGWTVFGEQIPPMKQIPVQPLEAGPHVRREEADNGRVRYISEIYGYAGLSNGRISVRSPIWISEDGMSAHFIILGDNPVLPTEAEAADLLQSEAVNYGVDHEAVSLLCREIPAASRAVVVARGTPPVSGKDGHLELLFPPLPNPAEFLEIGKAYFQKRDAVPRVERGRLLARRIGPKPGRPGIDVNGCPVRPQEGKPKLLKPGLNVFCKEADGEQLFYTSVSGWARMVRHTLSVMQRTRTREGLAYPTFRVDGDAEITDVMRCQARLEATGDVYIDGFIKPGTRVTAGGHMVVRGGISGAKVKVSGDLYAHSIEGSEVDVEGDLIVSEGIRDSLVTVRGFTTIRGNGKQRQACLSGGKLVAQLGLKTAALGDPDKRRLTRVIIGESSGSTPVAHARKRIVSCEQQIRSLIGSLKKETGSEKPLHAAVQQAPAGKRKFLLSQWDSLQKLVVIKHKLLQHIKALEDEQRVALDQARISVSEKIFPQIVLQIGNVSRVVDKPLEAALFHLDPERKHIVEEIM